jgi:D-glycero-alpha-D-manno-heptose-7-phosphate kinase
MIITQTPFRVSFAGGGTDLKEFYSREQGAVLSTTIKKYMRIAIHKSFDDKTLLKYSQTEIVDNAEQIKHPLIKQCFLKTNIKNHIEVTSFADIPASGSGLGSSSAFTIGLLKALYTMQHKNRSNFEIAKETCEIEIDALNEPIGKQDQYACAMGGFNLIRFNPDEGVFVEPLHLKKSIKNELNENLLMFYTGVTRKANTILCEQKKETQNKIDILRQMKYQVFDLRDALLNDDLTKFGEILHKGWHLKKQLTAGISNDLIDDYYNKAINAGAIGGKVLGAGGGGFILFYCPKNKQDNVRKCLNLKELNFGFEQEGSKIIYLEDDNND